jgi:transposase-like protein
LIRDTTRKQTKPMAVAAIEQYNRAKKELEESTLTTKDVAERFGVTRHAVYKWVRSGSLTAHDGPPEIGQVFDPEEVERFVPPPRGYRSHRKHASE